jgi:hypothetical protein
LDLGVVVLAVLVVLVVLLVGPRNLPLEELDLYRQ